MKHYYIPGENAAYEEGCKDVIKEVLEIIDTAQTYKMHEGEEDAYLDKRVLREAVEALEKGEHNGQTN